jgi:hypothetical protein
VPPLRHVRACVLAAATVTLLATPVVAGWAAPALPPELPPATRERLAPVTERASLATRVDGLPFQARRDVFEFLLDNPELATHLTRTLKIARYRIWAVPGAFGIDDGWGTVGTFEFVYVAPGIRVMHFKGEYQQRVLPNIRGEAIVTISYETWPATDRKSTIAAAVGTYVKLDSKLLRATGKLASTVAHAKAEKEGARLVRTFARATRAIEDNPTAVWEALRQRPDVPRPQLEEFRRLLSLPSVAEPAAAAHR